MTVRYRKPIQSCENAAPTLVDVTVGEMHEWLKAAGRPTKWTRDYHEGGYPNADRPRFRGPRPNGVFPAATADGIAGALAVGLVFWDFHPAPHCVWALDEYRKPHIVKIDRKNGSALHACTGYHGADTVRSRHHGLVYCKGVPGWKGFGLTQAWADKERLSILDALLITAPEFAS